MKHLILSEETEDIIWSDGTVVDYTDVAFRRELVRRYNVHAGLNTADVQKRVRKWVESRLGNRAMENHERGMRSLEESLELAQALSVTRDEALRLLDFVFLGDPGEIKQEIGGCMMTLLAAAEGAGYVASDCAMAELSRIETLPPEKFRKRQDHNWRCGIGAEREPE